MRGMDPERSADIVSHWLTKLARLSVAVEKQLGIRFYSSSLLLMYEGDAAALPREDVRLIDFAHTRQLHGHDAESPDEVGLHVQHVHIALYAVYMFYIYIYVYISLDVFLYICSSVCAPL